MLAVSNTFKTAMRQPMRQIRAHLKFDGGVIVSSDDNLINFEIERAGAPFLSSMSGFSATIIGTDLNLTGRNLEIFVEVQTDFAQNTFEKINLGTFTVAEQSVNFEKLTTTLKGYDQMGELASRDYVPNMIGFPITVVDLAERIAQIFELGFNRENFQNLPSANFEITQDLWAKINKTTFRSILDEICGATATTAQIVDSTLKFTPIKTPIVDTLTQSELFKLKFAPKSAPINALVLSRQPQEDNIALRDEEAVGRDGESEIKLANNEILDKNRAELIEPIFNAVKGFNFQPFEAETIGIFWFEIGDRILIQNGETSRAEGVISSIRLEISQNSIKEILTGKPLQKTKTDYKRAGGIAKTIFNTEIIVDKQNQLIENIVEEKREFEGRVEADFSKMRQDLKGFDIQIQKSGGLNLLKNTAFWSQTNGELNFWAVEGAVAAISSQEVKNYGGISGRVADLAAGAKLYQEVATVAGEIYSFSAKVKKSPLGALKFRLLSGQNILREEEIPAGVGKAWEEIAFTKVEATSPSLTLEILAENHPASLSDLMLANAPDKTLWTMAQGEIANTGVVIDEKGITVNSSINQGDTVEITPLEFAGYSQIGGSRKRVFSVNKDTTEVKKLQAEDELSMAPLKIVAIKTGDTQGWAFVGDAK